MTSQNQHLVDDIMGALPEWMARQRWYAAKNRTPRLRLLGGFALPDPAGEVDAHTLLVADDGGPTPVVYQVPLTVRATPVPELARARVATVGAGEQARHVYDGPHDQAWAALLLDLVQHGGEAVPLDGDGERVPAVAAAGTRHPAWSTGLTSRASRVLSGEQSNTSVIHDCLAPDGTEVPVICKVFRALAHGENPDVVLQGALAEAGSRRVPASVGHVTGRWSAHEGEDAGAGHLAFVQEFLPGSEDAWRVALRAARAGDPFTGRARALGEATAEVHELLARSLPTEPAEPDRVAEVTRQMEQRLLAALAEVPPLAAHEDELRAVLAGARETDWPAFQRVHGDYHLGQVLDVPERGWVLLDFEGEPLRPLAERTRTDQWMRDVAGMLRSFDYAGGSVEQEHGGDARAWVDDAQTAFLDGYTARSGRDPRDDAVLLAAFQLDKALYEVVYEASNRPTWLTIPTTAINRLLQSTKEVTP